MVWSRGILSMKTIDRRVAPTPFRTQNREHLSCSQAEQFQSSTLRQQHNSDIPSKSNGSPIVYPIVWATPSAPHQWSLHPSPRSRYRSSGDSWAARRGVVVSRRREAPPYFGWRFRQSATGIKVSGATAIWRSDPRISRSTATRPALSRLTRRPIFSANGPVRNRTS